MKTQIVYAVISTETDTYLEQTLCSSFSAKYYNPTAKTILVVDTDTDKSLIDNRALILKYIDEKIVIKIDDKFTKKQKSRWLKTNLRNLIDGDYLFIDSDTIITEQLDEVDSFDCQLAAVKDLHLDFNTHVYKDIACRRANKVKWDISEEELYFNSGVFFVKDNETTRSFYSLWHRNWLESIKVGIDTDQQSLAQTNKEQKHLITEIDGTYNCQVRTGISFLYKAKIVHFFNSWGKTEMSPFFSNNFFSKIKKEGLSDITKKIILNCKSEFNLPIILIDSDEFAFKRSTLYIFFHSIYSHSFTIFRVLNFSIFLFVKPIMLFGKLLKLKKK